MAINTNLLIAPVSFQEALVDRNGSPMSAGIVTCYVDSSRTTLKNWYYQTGTAGAYTYAALPNPLTLSAAGTVCDANGADVIPYFYPYNEQDQSEFEPYYITIVNSAGTNQITRSNFPAMSEQSATTSAAAAENYIINNVFWRNVGNQTLSAQTQITLAPSQHDGFQYPDMQFFKSNTTATETANFQSFALSTEPILTGDITPEYYLEHICTGAGTGETFKYYQFPISLHVNTLASVPFTFTIQAKSTGALSTQASTIYAYIYQSCGTNAVSPDPFLITSITLNSAWTKYTFSSIFPSTAGLSLSATGDDALYLQIAMPLNVACDISFTKPSIYLIEGAPTNSFQTYDQIDAIVSSARTGDIRFSLNSFSPMGWVPANDGTIGSATSGATTRANVDTWPLYNLIWNSVSNSYAPVSGGRGASAYADFIANKSMALTKMLSRVLGSVGPGSGLTNWSLGQTTGVESFVMSATQMPSHTHNTVITTVNQYTGAIAEESFLTPADPAAPEYTKTYTSSSTGGTDSISLMQPAVFYNAFFKL